MKNLYQETFDEIHASEALRREVRTMTKQKQKRSRRKLPGAALAAVIVAIALMGTAVAALTVPGSIQEWFAGQWDGPMEEDQAALIDRLTQEIGVSDTDGSTTVTVDSVTVGESVLWLLLRAEGESFQPFRQEQADLEYSVRGLKLSMVPEKEGEAIERYGYSLFFVGAGEDGKLLMLLRILPIMPEGQFLTDGGYQVKLHMEGVDHQENGAPKRHILEGVWDLDFTLEPTEKQQVLSAGTVTVPGERLEPQESVEAELHNVEVSATGLRYTMAEEENLAFETMVHIFPNWELELKDGTRLSHSGGTGHWSPENGGQKIQNYYWAMPIDLSQVKALWFRDRCFPLS